MGHSSTVLESIERTTASMASAGLFFGHGTETVEDEAAWLVLAATGLPLDGTFDDWDKILSAAQQDRIDQLLDERIRLGKPLAYLLGYAFFAGMEFIVNEHVLVPRSPIAELIVDQFSPWLDAGEEKLALDLCTGCGCIAIAMATYLPGLKVDASDISPEALAVAQRNVRRHGVESRVRLMQSDLFDQLGDDRYDLIVSNPPYVPAGSITGLPKEFLAEPRLGLESGDDGLDACLQILRQAPAFLADQGFLLCEVGESQHRLAELLPRMPFLWLEFSAGGSGVFLLSRTELISGSADVAETLRERVNVR